jgi:hypothetical protein
MKVALIGHGTEVIEGDFAFLYGTKKEAKKVLKNIIDTYSENGKDDYEIVRQSEIEISEDNYNAKLDAYKL